MSQQVLHEDHLPAILDLYNQSIFPAANVKHGVGVDEVGMGINKLDFVNVFPRCGCGDLMPLRNRPFEGMIFSDCFPPSAFANHVHLIRRFANCEVALHIRKMRSPAQDTKYGVFPGKRPNVLSNVR